jgi:cytochrome o ubiquinol oxidase operon protein cyoD
MSHQPEIHGAGHGTQLSYIIGFILSILLTIIPYTIVVHHLLSSDALVISIVVLGVLQLLVQLIFFLHLSAHPSQRWNVITFAFTLLILVILVAGSLWIMWNMNYNMMEHAN